MDFYFGLAQIVGVHTILGLSAYVILLTGQLSMAQAGFAAIGAYVAAMMTVLVGWHIVPAVCLGSLVAGFCAFLVGFPALRVRGLMLVVATIAFGEAVRLFFFNFDYQIAVGTTKIGPIGAEGFRQIRFFPEHGWSTWQVALLICGTAVLIMAAIMWLDRSRFGTVLRAVGEDELAAQCVGINITAVKVTAVTLGGAIAGIAGGLYAHYTTHIEHSSFTLVLATFAVVYPVLGGMTSVIGTLFAVIFVQVGLVEVLRSLGDFRSLLFGVLIILAMNLRPQGLIDRATIQRLRSISGMKA